MMGRGAMSLIADRTSVRRGAVSFLVTNPGSFGLASKTDGEGAGVT